MKRILNYLNRILGRNVRSFNLIKDPSSRLNSSLLSGNVIIEEKVKIINGVKIDSLSKVSIGRFTSITGPNTFINSYVHEILIGNFCSIASGVTIQEYNHHSNKLSTFYVNKNLLKVGSRNDVTSKGPIKIGHDVWIGTNSTILSGVTIGDGAIVAANSVVTKDIPEYAIVGGNPARLIRFRFEVDIINYVKSLKWWYWDIQKIERNAALFNCDCKEIPKTKINN